MTEIWLLKQKFLFLSIKKYFTDFQIFLVCFTKTWEEFQLIWASSTTFL